MSRFGRYNGLLPRPAAPVLLTAPLRGTGLE
jgi:hypothetical protein